VDINGGRENEKENPCWLLTMVHYTWAPDSDVHKTPGHSVCTYIFVRSKPFPFVSIRQSVLHRSGGKMVSTWTPSISS